MLSHSFRSFRYADVSVWPKQWTRPGLKYFFSYTFFFPSSASSFIFFHFAAIRLVFWLQPTYAAPNVLVSRDHFIYILSASTFIAQITWIIIEMREEEERKEKEEEKKNWQQKPFIQNERVCSVSWVQFECRYRVYIFWCVVFDCIDDSLLMWMQHDRRHWWRQRHLSWLFYLLRNECARFMHIENMIGCNRCRCVHGTQKQQRIQCIECSTCQRSMSQRMCLSCTLPMPTFTWSKIARFTSFRAENLLRVEEMMRILLLSYFKL